MNNATGAASVDSAARSLLDLHTQATAQTDDFILQFAKEHGTDWLKSTLANQSEAKLRQLQKDRATFSAVADSKAFRFSTDLKELLNPVKLVAAAAKAGGGWYKALGHFVEGAHILARASSATPIGLAANGAIFVYDVSTDLLDAHTKRQEERWAREYDLPMNDLVSKTKKLFDRVQEQLALAEDVKAHTRSGPGLGSELLSFLAAAQVVNRDADPEAQRKLLQKAHQHVRSLSLLGHTLRYLKDQQLLAVSGAAQCALLQVAFEAWAQNPTQLLGEIARDVSKENKDRWENQRLKLLASYAQRFDAMSQAFLKARGELDGEMFLAALILAGAAAYTSSAIQPRYQKTKLLGM